MSRLGIRAKQGIRVAMATGLFLVLLACEVDTVPVFMSAPPSDATPALGPQIVAIDASEFAPTVDYFGLGWREGQITARCDDEYLLSCSSRVFVETAPPTSLTIDITIHQSGNLAREAYNKKETDHRNQGKDKPNVGEASFKVRTEYLAVMVEELYWIRHNVVGHIQVGRNGYSLTDFDTVRLARDIDQRIKKAPLVTTPTPLPTPIQTTGSESGSNGTSSSASETTSGQISAAQETSEPISADLSSPTVSRSPTPTTPTPSPTPMPAIQVTKTADTNDGTCDRDCSLREAIKATSPDGTIDLPAGIYTLALGELVIDKNLILSGAGPENTVIQAAETLALASYSVSKIVGPESSVTVSGVTIRFGSSRYTNYGGGVTNAGILKLVNTAIKGNEAAESGGGILNYGTLTLINTVVSDNLASRHGGGIFSSSAGVTDNGTITMINSSVSGNRVTGQNPGIYRFGGGIYSSGGVLTVSDSVIRGNEAQLGGGIYRTGGPSLLENSTVSGNEADVNGGGIYNGGGSSSVTNMTFSGNTANNDGGGLFMSGGSLTVTNNTFNSNHANRQGGGIYNDGVRINLVNTIVAGNTSSIGPDCAGELTSLGRNLVGNSIGCNFSAATGDQVGFQFSIDPKLAPLQDNGGPTKTHALLDGSPAIGAGDDDAAPQTDQRGNTRTHGNSSDIGAFEF